MTDGVLADDNKAAGRVPAIGALAFLLAVVSWAFREPLVQLVTSEWSQEEYSHAYMIPFIALFIVATRSRELAAAPWTGSLAGVGVLVVAFVLLVASSLSSIYTIGHVGYVVALWGAFLAVLGWPAVRTIWPALAYLVFMVTLPDFLEVKLTAGLQLISSQIGVAVIRLAGMSVYLEGNVIDLGAYRLQVAEACSGLRYLFPLMSFGFLCAVLLKAPLWQRVVVFLASVPLTVLMNSFRIGVIGVLVNLYGSEQAEGFLHDFEGWVVFMGCVAILFALMWLMLRLSGRPFLKSLRMDTPPVAEMARLLLAPGTSRVAVTAVVATVAVAVVAGAVQGRPERLPERASLSTFPLVLTDWRGQEQRVEDVYLDQLRATDTFLATYARPADELPVALWIAYYASQRRGEAVHSPAACLPGGGWLVESSELVDVAGADAGGAPVRVNRVVIAQGEQRQLVYYWFPQRGRNLTNEYLVKWYIFWDSLTKGRSDGALVRLTTPVLTVNDLEEADQRLQAFIRDLDPKLSYFLPPAEAASAVAVASAL
jgi:exosortase D (VPLPA-CTERM-specific)